ncbi:MAG: hypothetical protein HY344_02190 [Candidatus Levybacteria bacterium]|nr:hypothetical protein [Candidatus Levybacteria bacterium]
MKRRALITTLFFSLLFLLVTPGVFSQYIQTGDASSYSKVETNIQGNGSVQTHIEVEANGEKKVLDADSPGTYELKVESNSDNSSNVKPTPTKSATHSATPTPDVDDQKENLSKKSFIQSFIETLSNLIKRIFNNL